jgi:hypothetical protein
MFPLSYLDCPAFLIAISVWSNVNKPENNVGIMLGLCGVRVTRSLVLYVCFVDRVFNNVKKRYNSHILSEASYKNKYDR